MAGPYFRQETRFYLGRLRRLFDPRFRASLRRLRELKDRHRGQRCFILGNGPSLRYMDLSMLAEEITFGLNRIYLLFDRLGFATTYFAAVNPLVLEQCAGEIAARVPGPMFIDWEARDLFPSTKNIIFLKSYHEAPRFFTDITRGVWQGATVTYVALQVAYFLGCNPVILVGVDHAYQARGRPHNTVVSAADDPDHFDPDYFGPGFRWQLPDLAGSELAYRIAHYAFRRDGREILDATRGGHLQVFPKVDYDSLF